MGLTQALATSVTGLRTTQAGLALIASNVANAQTPGYVRKTLVQSTTSAGGNSVGVRVAAITREFDQYVQRQYRIESAGGSYASMRADFYSRLQQLYGQPGAESSLETVFNKFTDALQQLATSPDSVSARSTVLSSAQVLTQQLNSMTTDIQGLRSDAERALSDAVNTANDSMAQIAALNQQLATLQASDATAASLLDQRDIYIDRLSQLMDVSVVTGEHNQVNIFTNSGIQVVGTLAAHLSFNAQGTVTPAARWDADPSKSTVGSLQLVLSSGGTFDLIANKSLRAGEIAALVDMRDNVLVEAQNQLDAMAAGLSRSLSDKTTAGTAVNLPPQAGFSADIGGLLAGNTINLTYTDNLTSQQHRVTIVRVDDPNALPLAASATLDPNDEVVGISFSGGMASVVAQLNAQFAGQLVFSNPAGTTLQVLDDGAPDLSDVDALSVTQTLTSLTGGSAELPFFNDASTPYTGAISSLGSQSIGFAGRIVVNPALLADPTRLVVYSTSPLTSAGDPTRPNFIYRQLVDTPLSFSADTGMGEVDSPFTAPLGTFLRQLLSNQGETAANAENLAKGQEVVVNALKQRVADGSAVNVDVEMANLLTLQTAYGANARVMSTVKEMLEILLRM
jgi:flagellar hook-associated protein 1